MNTIDIKTPMKVCEMGMECKSTKVAHFVNFWHAPKKLIKFKA